MSMEILMPGQSTPDVPKDSDLYDIQIATAKRYPRVVGDVLVEAMQMATINADVAAEMGFAKPCKKWDEKTGQYVDDFILGASVRLAEVFASCWGNLRSQTEIIGHDGKVVKSRARVIDLQKNVAHEEITDRGILTSKGKTFPEHMIITTGKAAAAIAYRNCIFKVIPAAYMKSVYDAAMKLAEPEPDEMPGKREAAINHFVALGVTVEQVLKAIHVSTIDDIGPERLQILRGLANGIKAGDTTVADVFPGAGNPGSGDKPSGAASKAQKQAENLLKKK